MDKKELMLAMAMGGGAGASKYTVAFNATTDWTASGDNWTVTVSAGTHKVKAPVCVSVFSESAGSYIQTKNYPGAGYSVTIDAQNNVVLTVGTDSRFAGQLVIY